MAEANPEGNKYPGERSFRLARTNSVDWISRGNFSAITTLGLPAGKGTYSNDGREFEAANK
jgi:hypothetical protein